MKEVTTTGLTEQIAMLAATVKQDKAEAKLEKEQERREKAQEKLDQQQEKAQAKQERYQDRLYDFNQFNRSSGLVQHMAVPPHSTHTT